MKIGFIGLGKMGSNMTKRLLMADHEVVAYDPSDIALQQAELLGATAVRSREEVVGELKDVVIWLMIPAAFVDQEIDALLEVVGEGAVIVDGGNSDYRLSQARYARCKQKNVSFVDVGTSGGILGLTRGYAMMVGGDADAIATLAPIFTALAPPDGWHHFGQSGSGHYVKMVHNAIEYGLMESYAEGYRMLNDGPIKNIDLVAAGTVWKNGSIIGSLLNDLTVEALKQNPTLDGVDGYVAESGETRWMLETAKDHHIELPVIQQALQVRLASHEGATNFATKLLAVMRNKFGGHAIPKDRQ